MTPIFMRFPGGRAKALTLSYDDGVEQDIRLIEILNRYGLKATFNLNSHYPAEDVTYPDGTIHRRMPRSRATEVYTNSGHEVAVHTYDHPWLNVLSPANITFEVLKDREELEAQFGRIVRGMAYPYGRYNDTIVDCLRACGIVYSRTTVSTEKFDIPTDWLRMPATCHHKNPRLTELADKFLTMTVKDSPALFYLWGHSYEFEADNNWHVIEDFAARMGGKEDIWYATNMEIYEYVTAYRNLVFSADCKTVYNPSSLIIWAKTTAGNIKIEPGQTLRLYN